ncbi:esterase/lipase family protein [Corynebacterium hylobatis]|uniref:esterase/lipase family protein n=1 Tax=Corynebacterium hylobatis TaxID=1859290 RepID=UPI001F4A0435|nr:alpha/beta fold hydrolase [Corynebacterium hylobatis]
MTILRNSLRALATVLAAVIAGTGTATAAPVLPALPAQSSLPSHPAINPVFNDPSCIPSPAHPNPVVYFHGTGTDSNDFVDGAHFLRSQGFCLWTHHYGTGSDTLRNLVPGHRGLGPIDQSVEELADVVDGVLATTGAQKVDVVGYSQGGMLTKAYTQGRGAGKVGRAVSIAATFRGTTIDGVVPVIGSAVNANRASSEHLVGASTLDQFADSDFIGRISALPDTTAGIIYTALYTPSDTVATPYQTSMLEAVDGADVANINIEAVCGRGFAHQGLPRTTEVIHLVHWGLTRAPGQTTATPENCRA